MKFSIKLYQLLPFILLVFTSCDGQNISKKASQVIADSKEIIALGDTVSELDKTIMIIYQDKKDNYWFGSKEQGVYKYDGKILIRFSTKDGLGSNRIQGIQEDKQGNIYFDSGAGVTKYDGYKFETLKVIRNSIMVKNEWELAPDDLWFIGSWTENGPFRYDGKNLYHLEFDNHPWYEDFKKENPSTQLEPLDVYSVYKDKKGHIWFGTVVFGVAHFDGNKVSWILERELEGPGDGRAPAVRSIIEDKNGHYWLSNIISRYEINSSSMHFSYEKLKGISSEEIKDKIELPYFMSMVNDKNGDLWMVSYSAGVWRYDGEKLINHTVKENNKIITLFSIYKDNHDVLWLGTENNGAYRYNGQTFERFELDSE